MPLDEAGTDLAGASERIAHVARAAARDLHARLRLDELRGRRRLRHDEHARSAASHGARRAGARRSPRARGLRHRAPRDGQGADRRRADRPSAPDPALHRHPLRRTERRPDADGDGRPAPGRARSSRPSRSAACSCRSSRRPRSQAAMCASASRTTSISHAAFSQATATSSSVPSAILDAMNVRILGPEESAGSGLWPDPVAEPSARALVRAVGPAPGERVHRDAVRVGEAGGRVEPDEAPYAPSGAGARP